MGTRYSRGDRVKFVYEVADGSREFLGEIAIVDENGCFEFSDEPSYDIYAEYEGRRWLFKHVRESEILDIVRGNIVSMNIIPEQPREMKELLIKAKKIAYKAHEGQLDKAGMPYIEHPLVVSSRCRTMDAKIVGALHDVIEDTAVTYEELRKEGFPEYLLEALRCVTKEMDWKEDEYFKRIKENPIAKEVKIQDLLHNLDVNRILDDTDKMKNKRIKYEKALLYLCDGVLEL